MPRLALGLAAMALVVAACSESAPAAVRSLTPAPKTPATTVTPATADAPTTKVPDESPVTTATQPGYTAYVSVTDDSGNITVDVPAEWSEVLGVAWERDGGLIGPALSASPDVDAFINTWGTPGVFLAASSGLSLTPTELLDSQVFSEACASVERVAYDDGVYTGEMDMWQGCGDEGSDFFVFTAQPPGGDFTILAQIVMVTEADRAAAEEIIASFLVDAAPAP